MNSFTCTYSPEDDKLRLYVGRVPRADYDALREAGFVATPKQDCDFVAVWTPNREDLAREFLEDGEDIGDEDYSPQERSADRAERFEGYREKRTDESLAGAEAFEQGPQVFAHHRAERAERQARRHDRNRTYAVTQWSKAEYWQERTAGVISHALHRSSARVRRGRILTLEGEQRKHEKSREEYAARFAAWNKVLTLEGIDSTVVNDDSPGYCGISAATLPAPKLAYHLANNGNYYGDFTHPRRPDRKTSLYSLLTDAADPITAREAAALWLKNARDPADPTNHSGRWSAHYELRLAYERAMLAEEGGTAAEADMEPGGWIKTGNRTGSVLKDVETGWKQIQSVNKSPVTKRVTSVKVWGTTTGYTAESDYKQRATKPCLVSVNVERLGEDAYREPTDEERAAFAVATKERKKAEKEKKPKEPPLVNPTDADADRLQAIWNASAKAKHDQAKKEGRVYGEYVPVEILRMTQAQYSARSKGSYASCETRTVHAGGMLARRTTNMWSAEGAKYDKEIGPALCKVRIKGYSPCSVIVITDKPQKDLPLDWSKDAVQKEAVPA